MFKVPKSLTHMDVLGKEIPVVIDDERCKHMGAAGLFDGNIILRSKYESQEYFMTVLVHETFHAHCYTVGLQLDQQIEEVLATTSERLFMSALKALSHCAMIDEESEPKKPRGRPKGSKNKK